MENVRKNKNGLYVVIVTLLILLIIIIGYMVCKKVFNKNAEETSIIISAKELFKAAQNEYSIYEKNGTTLTSISFCSTSLNGNCKELPLKENNFDYYIAFEKEKIVRLYVGKGQMMINVENENGINLDDLGKKYKLETPNIVPILTEISITTIDSDGNLGGGIKIIELKND